MTPQEKVKYILGVRYWTQEQLAEVVGTSQVGISKWLRGKKPIKKNIVKIDEQYRQARAIAWQREQKAKERDAMEAEKKAVRAIPRVLSKRGKIRLKFPWYSHQK